MMQETIVSLVVWVVILALVVARLVVAVGEQQAALDDLKQMQNHQWGLYLNTVGEHSKALLELREELDWDEEDFDEEDPEGEDDLHLIEERLDRLEDAKDHLYDLVDCCLQQTDGPPMEKVDGKWVPYDTEAQKDDRREERCLTGQCHPTDCEREQCPHRTQEFTVSPFRGVLHQFDGQELEDTVLFQQPVQVEGAEWWWPNEEKCKQLGLPVPEDSPQQIDLAEERHWEKEPPKADTQPPTKVINE